MGYTMSFYDTTPRPLYISEIRDALHEIDSAFEMDEGSDALGHRFLLYAGSIHAEIAIHQPGSDEFERGLASILSQIAESNAAGRDEVERVVRTTQREICLCVRYGGRDCKTTLSRLDLLWDWLFAQRSGLLYAEGEGFYEGEELVLAVK